MQVGLDRMTRSLEGLMRTGPMDQSTWKVILGGTEQEFDVSVPAERAELVRIYQGLYDNELNRACAEACWGSALLELEEMTSDLERNYPRFQGPIL